MDLLRVVMYIKQLPFKCFVISITPTIWLAFFYTYMNKNINFEVSIKLTKNLLKGGLNWEILFQLFCISCKIKIRWECNELSLTWLHNSMAHKCGNILNSNRHNKSHHWFVVARKQSNNSFRVSKTGKCLITLHINKVQKRVKLKSCLIYCAPHLHAIFFCERNFLRESLTNFLTLNKNPENEPFS